MGVVDFALYVLALVAIVAVWREQIGEQPVPGTVSQRDERPQP